MKFRIELGDKAQEYRATRYEDFNNDLCYATDEAGYRFFVDGKIVNRNEAFSAVTACREAQVEKKEQTHKRVRICRGVTALPNNWHEVWVRKEGH